MIPIGLAPSKIPMPCLGGMELIIKVPALEAWRLELLIIKLLKNGYNVHSLVENVRPSLIYFFSLSQVSLHHMITHQLRVLNIDLL